MRILLEEWFPFLKIKAQHGLGTPPQITESLSTYWLLLHLGCWARNGSESPTSTALGIAKVGSTGLGALKIYLPECLRQMLEISATCIYLRAEQGDLWLPYNAWVALAGSAILWSFLKKQITRQMVGAGSLSQILVCFVLLSPF